MNIARNTGNKKLKLFGLVLDIRKSVVEILNRPISELKGHQAFKDDHKTLAFWAADCTAHVLSIFEAKYPKDNRPRKAIEAVRTWAVTGIKMEVIRKGALDSHAAARSVGEDSAEYYVARSAGHAAAAAHVATHSLGAAAYAIKAVSLHSGNIDDGLIKERDWQRQRLMDYAQKNDR